MKGNPKVNALFVAEVFNTKNGLIYEGEVDFDAEGTKEERAFRLWINSLGIDDVFVRGDLYGALEDGIYILKVCDFIKKGTVDWSKVAKK